MENNKWKMIQKKPILKGPSVLCGWPSKLRPYPSLAHLVKNELEKFAKEQQLALANDNDETLLNQPEIGPDCQSELPQSNYETSESNPPQSQSNSESPQSIPQPPQPNSELPQSNPEQTESNSECTNLLIPESNLPLPPSTSTHFFHFLRLMQMFPETHPATLHTVMTMSGNKFFVAIDKLLFAQRSRNDMMSKTIRPSGVIRERGANSFGIRSHSNRGRPPKTQKYEPCLVSNNLMTDVLESKNKYLTQTSTLKNQKRPTSNNEIPNQKHPCHIENNDILEMYYDPSLDEETFEDLIENEDPSLNGGFIGNEDVLMMDANEEPANESVVVDISDDESK